MGYTVETAIDKLAQVQIINSPSYWKKHYTDVKYTGQLLIKSAEKLNKVGPRAATVEDGITALVSAGIINTPQYWIAQTGMVTELLKALGGAAAIINNPKMKYTDANPPTVCMMTNSTCYKQTSPMVVKGVLWHSTGANNPNLKRYVQPSENDPDYLKLMSMIGKNTYNNDWNHINVSAGLNAWIGKLEDGTVTTLQAMPWNYKPWGCGGGSRGSCNNGWIQFEICEDGLADPVYFNKVYREACELTAYLCKKFNLDPNGVTTLNGVKVPVILCHADSCRLGLGSNHGDVLHWFPKFGKDMVSVREDVAKILKGNSDVSITVVDSKDSSYSGRVTANLLNVRSGPGLNYPVITTYPKDTIVAIESEKDGWGKIKDRNSWVSLSYIEKV